MFQSNTPNTEVLLQISTTKNKEIFELPFKKCPNEKGKILVFSASFIELLNVSFYEKRPHNSAKKLRQDHPGFHRNRRFFLEKSLNQIGHKVLKFSNFQVLRASFERFRCHAFICYARGLKYFDEINQGGK